ncbi:hypothetical protein CLCR_09614 [Cladophialophora carrionii]|uniref:C2H2-type domain-containing protein n=1 Tax=Cladophialophora carrionii TaxID=86049 RepID=A0A1C1CVY2_9EURO|nr:hypothetical protein CLCR_09614 [Cladophialophora carrionii]
MPEDEGFSSDDGDALPEIRRQEYLDLLRSDPDVQVTITLGDETIHRDMKEWKSWCRAWKQLTQESGEAVLESVNVRILNTYLRFKLDKARAAGKNVGIKAVRSRLNALARLHIVHLKREMDKKVKETVAYMLHQGGSIYNDYQFNNDNGTDDVDEPITLSLDDFNLLLYVGWTSKHSYFVAEGIRIRTHFLNLFCGYTGTRPGAVLGSDSEASRSNKRYLRFCHCKIVLLRGREEDPNARPLRVLEVILKHRKNKAKPLRVVFIFTENPILALCPVTFFLTAALESSAFHSGHGIRCMDDIDKLRVVPGRQTQELLWRDDMRDSPVFPAYEHNGTKWVPTNRPMPQQRVRKYLKKLSVAAHWGLRPITLYSIRRAVGTRLNGEPDVHAPLTTTLTPAYLETSTPAERNVILGHSSTVFQQYYLSRRATHDVQNAFLGLPQDSKVQELAKRVFRDADPRVQKSLSSADISRLNADPELFQLNTICTELTDRIAREKAKSKTVRAPPTDKTGRAQKALRRLPHSALLDGSGPCKEHMTLHMRKQEAKRRQRNVRDRLERREFPRIQKSQIQQLALRDTSDQLLGRPPEEAQLEDAELDANSPRRKIAALLFTEPDQHQYPIRSEADGRRRIEAVNLLVAHCGLQERRPTPSVKWKCEGELGLRQVKALEDESARARYDARVTGRSDLKMGPLDCIFCAFDSRRSRTASYTFSTKQSLIRHADRSHFHHLEDGSERNCPHPECSHELWYTADRLKIHAAKVHGVEFFTRTRTPGVREVWD